MSNHTPKLYRCRECGHEQMITTNHFGECYSFLGYNRCPNRHLMPVDPEHPERVEYSITVWERLETPETQERKEPMMKKRKYRMFAGYVTVDISAESEDDALGALLDGAHKLQRIGIPAPAMFDSVDIVGPGMDRPKMVVEIDSEDPS